MKGKYYSAHYTYIFGKAKSIGRNAIPGKNQFGDLAHAKKALQKYVGVPLTWKKDSQVDYNLWYAYDSSNKWRGEIWELDKVKKNPANKKQRAIEHFTKLRFDNVRDWSVPKTQAMYNFLLKEAPHRVTGLSIEPDGVFIYTDSEYWQDDAGAGTFREDSETLAIKRFYERVQPGVKSGRPLLNPRRKKEQRSRIINGVEFAVMFTGDGWRVMRFDGSGVGHTEFNAGPGDAGREAALLHLKGMRAKPPRKKTRKKNPTKRFTAKQLATMRREYGKIKRVDPAGGTYQKIAVFLDALPQSLLKQLSQANINFISLLALNRVKRKKNPARPDYIIFNFSARGGLGFLHATNTWVNRLKAVRFSTQKFAAKIAKSAAKTSKDLIGVAPENMSDKEIIADIQKVYAGKGKRRRNPVGPTQREIDSANNLFRDFTGDHPERMQKVKLSVPKTGLAIGELDGVMYTTVRDGKTEKYQHDFKKGSRPLLASSHDGKSLHVLGGEYEFTERGIEDK